jgi:hypothetical protein
MSFYDLVFRCAAEILRGRVLQADGVTAGNGDVIDWRSVRCGERAARDADAFEQARLFVELAGRDAVVPVLEDLD